MNKNVSLLTALEVDGITEDLVSILIEQILYLKDEISHLKLKDVTFKHVLDIMNDPNISKHEKAFNIEQFNKFYEKLCIEENKR